MLIDIECELRLGSLDQASVPLFLQEEFSVIMKIPRYQSKGLYVADLHPSAIEKVDELSELFSQAGTLEDIRIVAANPNPAENAGRQALCSAYVDYTSVEDACRAWQTLNYHFWENVPMRIMFSNLDPASRYNEKANIIITNLDESIDSKTLHHHFGQFGVVISSKVERGPMGKSTGRGFVQFQDEDEAQEAIQKMNNTMLEGNRVYVGLFIRRTDHRETANKSPLVPSTDHSEMANKNSNVASSESWPPQPWSVEMLETKLGETHSQEERKAMLGATLLPLVSKHTKDFASDVTNELVKLPIGEIPDIMRMKDDVFYREVERVKKLVLERIKEQPPFLPTAWTELEDEPEILVLPVPFPVEALAFSPPARYFPYWVLNNASNRPGTGYFDISDNSDDISSNDDSLCSLCRNDIVCEKHAPG